ncbi:MAG: helix-hairpin-helix domain-containing protein [Pseudomonadota bacterium]
MRKENRSVIVWGLLVVFLAIGTIAQAKTRPNEEQKQKVEGVVNINSATAAQIVLLPGIGPSKAQSIVDHREKRKFSATYEIIRVRGIGRKTFYKLRPYLTVSGPTTLTSKPQLKK